LSGREKKKKKREASATEKKGNTAHFGGEQKVKRGEQKKKKSVSIKERLRDRDVPNPIAKKGKKRRNRVLDEG